MSIGFTMFLKLLCPWYMNPAFLLDGGDMSRDFFMSRIEHEDCLRWLQYDYVASV